MGSIRIGRPMSFGTVTAVALACAVALVSYATWGEFTRKVSVPGVLVPEGGLMHLGTPQAATVAEVLVKEGDAVQAGQALIRLRAERMLTRGELGQLQAAAVAERRNSLEAELHLAERHGGQRPRAGPAGHRSRVGWDHGREVEVRDGRAYEISRTSKAAIENSVCAERLPEEQVHGIERDAG